MNRDGQEEVNTDSLMYMMHRNNASPRVDIDIDKTLAFCRISPILIICSISLATERLLMHTQLTS